MSAPVKFTNQQIIDAYRETGSVWRAAKILGACGQSVWERLRAIGVQLPGAKWTESEVEELKSLAPECTIGEIARRLGRPYSGVAGKISQLQIGVRFGNAKKRKVPRGAGLTKKSVGEMMKALIVWNGSVRQFAIQRGLSIEPLIHAFQKYVPDEWNAYVRSHADLKPKACSECKSEFFPFNSKQETCSRICAGRRRSNLQYLGGKRSFAVGMEEGVCQLCEKECRSRLAAHHLIGKANDPDNEYLIALCNGCHQLVTLLGGRADLRKVEFWENLISLAVLRKEGHTAIDRVIGHHVTVEIEDLDESDLEPAEDSQAVTASEQTLP